MPLSIFPFLSVLRIVKTAAALLILLALIAPAAGLGAQDLTVDYTGRLFGYYRIEPSEGTALAPMPRLQAVQTFLQKRDNSKQLLLGMGDNYAPEFEASIQLEFDNSDLDPMLKPCVFPAKDPVNTEDYRNYAPESLYKSSRRIPVMADCDNVSRFLITAGYRAVVPGREDFIYSATWLRQIGLLFKGASNSAKTGMNPLNTDTHEWNAAKMASHDLQLHMLAANLRVKFVDDSAKPAKTFCHLLFSDNFRSSADACFKDDPTLTDEMNWLRRVDQALPPKVRESLQKENKSEPGSNPVEKLFRYKVQESLQRQSKSNRDFNTQLIQNQQAILKTLLQGFKDQLSAADETNLADIASCALSWVKPVPGDGKPQAKECKDLTLAPPYKPVATRDRLFAIASDLIDAIHKDSVDGKTLGDVLLPEDSRRKIRELLLGLIYREQKDIGFTIADLPNGKRALIIGVVGQETMQEISCENLLVDPIDKLDRPDALKAGADTLHSASAPANTRKTNPCGGKLKPEEAPIPGSVVVGDPRVAVEAILRAAWEQKNAETIQHPDPQPALFDRVIVMAQMPHTEADELGARVRSDIADLYEDEDGIPLPERPAIDLILSEAEPEHVSPTMRIDLNRNDEIPVLTPASAYDTQEDKSDSSPISRVTITDRPTHREYPQHIENTLHIAAPANTRDPDHGANQSTCKSRASLDLCKKSAASLLETELANALTLNQLHKGVSSAPESDLALEWSACNGLEPFFSTSSPTATFCFHMGTKIR